MKRLSRSTCCSDLFSCSNTSDQLQRLSIECPRQLKILVFFGPVITSSLCSGFRCCSFKSSCSCDPILFFIPKSPYSTVHSERCAAYSSVPGVVGPGEAASVPVGVGKSVFWPSSWHPDVIVSDTFLTLLPFDTPTETEVLILPCLYLLGFTVRIPRHCSHSQAPSSLLPFDTPTETEVLILPCLYLLGFTNVKTFASSDSLAKVQEVASWLLEMNQELLSVGSKRRRTGGSLRGNPSSSQADEEQMNRVVEEEQQQQLRQQDEEHTARNGEVVGAEPRPGDQNDSQQGQLEENNNRFISIDEDSSGNQEEQEEDEEHAGEQDEEDEEEEEMDQESDDFDQSDDSSREDEHTHSNSVTNSSSIVDLPIHQLSSPFYTKTTKVSTFSLLFT
ncbi:hypothetical protein CB1_001310006 [Camelus ferus]|nr:hypothetical protein CB1_001713007 [Camelus ferus]EPY77148.1 hypothetical protein CB1_001310006 [Camelus ferus]